MGPSGNQIAPSFLSRYLLDVAHGQQDSALALQMSHLVLGEILMHREFGYAEPDEISDVECPLIGPTPHAIVEERNR